MSGFDFDFKNTELSLFRPAVWGFTNYRIKEFIKYGLFYDYNEWEVKTNNPYATGKSLGQSWKQYFIECAN